MSQFTRIEVAPANQINKALVEYDFEDMWQQIEQNYQPPVPAIIPESHDILRVASSGIFCLQYPEHAISLASEKVAQQIVS